jgi:hypothetical protein
VNNLDICGQCLELEEAELSGIPGSEAGTSVEEEGEEE